jgi:hypothetical protein
MTGRREEKQITKTRRVAVSQRSGSNHQSANIAVTECRRLKRARKL